MAETVQIFGKPYPKTIVYVAGAGAVGIVGYAWWTKGGGVTGVAEGEIEEEELPEPVEEPEDEPGFGLIGGGAPPNTNQDWWGLATERLIALGVDPNALSVAIGKFLARQALTTAEATLVEQALAAAGPPPQNGPWVIIRQTPGGVTPPPGTGTPPFGASLPRPANLRQTEATSTSIRFRWNPVAGADGYAWALYKGHGVKVDSGRLSGVNQTTVEPKTLGKGRPYQLVVRAVSRNVQSLNAAKAIGRTKK